MKAKATVYYVDEDKTTADQRWDASQGKLLPEECYTAVAEAEAPLPPPCFTPKPGTTGEDLAAIQCDVIFRGFQERRGLRSMSIGDVIQFEHGGLYVCDRGGAFRPEEARFQ